VCSHLRIVGEKGDSVVDFVVPGEAREERGIESSARRHVGLRQGAEGVAWGGGEGGREGGG
jgi:hypothetical protein